MLFRHFDFSGLIASAISFAKFLFRRPKKDQFAIDLLRELAGQQLRTKPKSGKHRLSGRPSRNYWKPSTNPVGYFKHPSGSGPQESARRRRQDCALRWHEHPSNVSC